MTIKEAQILLRLFNSPQGQAAIKGIRSGNADFMNYITNAIGLTNPTQADLDQITSAANAFRTSNKRAPKSPNMEKVTRDLQTILMRDPKVMALAAGVTALSEGSQAVGNIMANNGNRLANAILASNRHNSQAQENLYGPGWAERNAGAFAEERRRKGETAKYITDAFSNTLNKVLGDNMQQYDTARTMAAGKYMEGVPGTFYNLVNGMQSRASKIGGK